MSKETTRGVAGPPGIVSLNNHLAKTKGNYDERQQIAELLRDNTIDVGRLLEPLELPNVDDEFRDSAANFEDRDALKGASVISALRGWMGQRLESLNADIEMKLYESPSNEYEVEFIGHVAYIGVPLGRGCVSNPPPASGRPSP